MAATSPTMARPIRDGLVPAPRAADHAAACAMLQRPPRVGQPSIPPMKVAASSAKDAEPTRIGDSLVLAYAAQEEQRYAEHAEADSRPSEPPAMSGSPLASRDFSLVRDVKLARAGLPRHREDARGDLRPRDDPGRLRMRSVVRDDRRQEPEKPGGQGCRIGSREHASRGGDRIPQTRHVVAYRHRPARGRLRHHEPPALTDGCGDQACARASAPASPRRTRARESSRPGRLSGEASPPQDRFRSPTSAHRASDGGLCRRHGWRAQGACWRSADR